MFRKSLVIFLLSILLHEANAQSLTVETYTHELLFNIFKDQPDTNIRPFLRLYTPSLLDKKTNQPEAASQGANKNLFEIHTFIFLKHPFFNASFTSGRLELYCQRFNEPKGVQVYDVKLWFEFDTQPEAEMAFSKLVETFIPISSNKKFSSTNGAQKAEFTDAKGAKNFNHIQFRLTADNLDRHRFKILFETENDLP